MKSYNTLFFVLLILLYSCSKEWLDVKSDMRQSTPSTLTGAQALLNNEGIINNESYSMLMETASDGFYVPESALASIADARSQNPYVWSQIVPYDVFNWQSVYNIVFVANSTLDGLKSYHPINSKEQEEWNDILGQALFHRSSTFYGASQIWAPPYNSETADSDLGIPLRLESDITLPSKRSTVTETYNQVINDLLICASLLSRKYVAKTRPFRRSVFAQLARVYLSMRKYDKAGVYADSCLKENSYLMNYDSLSITSNFIGDPNNNPEVIFHKAFVVNNCLLPSNLFIDRSLYDSYDINDLRKVVFFRENPDKTISYRGMYNNSTFYLFCGLANDELYLIRAEAYARAGNITLAMKDLNDLLRTRWRNVNGVSTYVNQIAIDANDALGKILIERKKELLMRGLRWTDLRRLNFEDRFKITLIRMMRGNSYSLEPGSFRYTFPIPNDVIAKTGVQQNAGW